MSVQRSVSRLFNSLQRPLDYPIHLLSGVASFDPASISGLRSRLLDTNTFTSPIDSKYYLADSSTTNTHLPRQGRCWLFDGTNDRAVLGSTISLTGEFTASIWVKPTTNGTQAIFGRNLPSGQMTYNNASGNITVETNTASSTAFSTGLTTGTWCHICITRDGSNLVTMYKNGVSVGTQTVTGTFEIGQIGCRNSSPANFWNGSFRDIRIYSSAKDSTAVAAIYNQSRTGSGTFDTTGLVGAYPCNEESGTTGYDISGNGNHLTLTNITQATFHATDTGVLENRNNAEGYRLSGAVYIPKRLSDLLAADGNALTVTGRAAYHGCAETPCFSGDGSTVYADLGSPLMPATGDYELSFWYYHTSAADERPFGQDSFIFYVNSQIVRARVFGTYNIVSGAILSNDTWNKITLNRTGDLHTMTVLTPTASYSYTYTGSGSNSVSANSLLLRGLSTTTAGRISDLRITKNGSTTYFPLQDGPGSSNTNRDIAWVKSDGTGGVISNAIVNGTVSTIWGNRVPGNVEDWCIKYGGRIAANGAFVAGMLTGDNAADGSAKTLTAGKFGNPFSRLNLNPATAAELNGRSVPTSAAAGADINATITPTDSAFRRTASDGDDRILIYDATLSGADLSNVEGYLV